MRKRAIAAALAVFGVALIWSTGAEAALTDLTVRIEGAQKTLFEGPIETDGHRVRAFSDPTARICDATNNGAHPAPGPTPTAASADAMELVGEGFDGEWYPGFDDYFIQRWGPDAEDAGSFAYWGVLVNGMFTSVGGCQYLAEAGDEVLWAYDAFNGRRLLWLAAADDPADAATAPSPFASVEVGQPLALRVEAGERPNLSPAPGVTVAPVATAGGSGFQTVETGSTDAVTTDGAGHASVTFSTPGWQRVKAQEESGFIRSNRLDVCVEPIGGGGCGAPLADTAVRVAPRYSEPPSEEGGGGGQPPSGGGAAGGDATSRSAAAESSAKPAGAISLRRTSLDRVHGTATLKLLVPGAGRLTVSGPRIVGVKLTSTAPKLVTVAIRPTATAREELLAKGRLAVTFQVRFTPRGGEPSLRIRGLTLKLRAAGG